MAEERTYYCFCEDNCKFETMTKEQIIAAIAEATGNVPEDVDDAFITKIKESNHNANLSFWKGTEAEFSALGVTAPVYKIGIDANGKVYFTPLTSNDYPAHAESHALDGDDPITPESIGAAKIAQYNTGTMLAARWSNKTYSFEADYPNNAYDISIWVAPTATEAQFDAFSGAKICGSAADNTVKALGTVPAVDIPIIVKAVAK